MFDEIEVRLPDGSSRSLPAGSTPADLAASIGRGLAKAAVAATVNGADYDLHRPLPGGGAEVAIVTNNTDKGRYVLRHSTAHVMAQAVCDLFPGAKYAIGPPIEDGFYYDFDLPDDAHFTEDDLGRIEARMREIVAADQPFVREELSREEGLKAFADQPFKVEIIEGVEEEEGAEGAVVSTYRNSVDGTSGWVDLCRGPHVPSTSRLGSFKLMRVAGAYWRGDERRPQLQRIYGTAWESDKALAEHLHRLEEAEKRDHRKLGVELDLFHFPPEIGGGLPVFHPKGGLIRKLMEDFSKAEHERAGYEFVSTPHISKDALFRTSGHLEWYADGMYPPMEMEGATYYAKPMNCPMHILIYKSRARSYRELPLRLFELGTVYRFEKSGVLHGLTRLRGFTQDDAHIFVTADQLAPELESLLAFVLRILRTFGLTEFDAELATRPDKFVGDPADWDEATEALRQALEAAQIPYRVAEGEGAFYAPKIDVHIKDAIGRRWQLSTLQVDFQFPHRFDMEYTGADNARHPPYMIHRALFGSLERFLAIILEHYAGALPTWLSPVQVRVLPVSTDHQEYAAGVVAQLREAGLRAAMEEADDTIGARIRSAKLEKLPYVVVVGADDVAAGTVGVNARDGAVVRGVAVDEFVARVRADVDSRRG
ncbi:MAG: threonine--tRNA ligase [Acidimicrobiales bacterium]